MKLRFLPARKTLWLWIVILILSVTQALLAQPQVLPSVEIASDELITAPLQKKILVFPLEVPQDSLPSYIPRGVPLQHQAQLIGEEFSRLGRLQLSLDTSLGASLSAALYPKSKLFPIVALDSRVFLPGEYSAWQNHRVHAQTRIAKSLLLSHALSWQNSHRDSLKAGIYSWTLGNRYPLLQIREAAFKDLSTQLVLEGWDQKLGTAESSNTAFGFSHSHRFHWTGHSLKNSFTLKDTAFGTAMLYHFPSQAWLLSSLHLGLLTDFHRIYPTVELHERLPLTPNLYLEFGNRTSLESNLDSALAYLYPYSLLPSEPMLSLVPLNFTARAFKTFSGTSTLQLIGLSHNLRYIHNQPQLYTLADSVHTGIFYADTWENLSRLELCLRVWELVIEQSVAWHLENLPGADNRRKAYSPLLQAETKIALPLRTATLSLSLEQEYLQQNEYRQDLPAVFDLSLFLRFPISKDLQISGALENIFDTPHPDFGHLPEPGRGIFLSIGYALDR